MSQIFSGVLRVIADLLFAKIPLLHFSGDIIACFLGLPLLAKNTIDQ